MPQNPGSCYCQSQERDEKLGQDGHRATLLKEDLRTACLSEELLPEVGPVPRLEILVSKQPDRSFSEDAHEMHLSLNGDFFDKTSRSFLTLTFLEAFAILHPISPGMFLDCK